MPAAALGGYAAIAYDSRNAGATLVIMEFAVVALLALTVLSAVLFGTDRICERVFRLLRLIDNRPEPPAPVRLSPQQLSAPQTAKPKPVTMRHRHRG